ncbi:MAG: TrbC/VirB2 family protein [Patescibacteria group bacterium]
MNIIISHTMKVAASVLVLLALVLPVSAVAQVTTETSDSGTFTLQNPLKVNSIGGLIQDFVEIFSYIAILFAVLLLIYVGLQFVLARGNSERLNDLKKWLFYIVIGVAVVIGARVIIQVVINTLSASGAVDQRTIQSAQRAANGR